MQIWDMNGFVHFLVLWKHSYNIWLWNLTKQQLENWIVRIEAALGTLARTQDLEDKKESISVAAGPAG